jgi:hypothetical protein
MPLESRKTTALPDSELLVRLKVLQSLPALRNSATACLKFAFECAFLKPSSMCVFCNFVSLFCISSQYKHYAPVFISCKEYNDKIINLIKCDDCHFTIILAGCIIASLKRNREKGNYKMNTLTRETIKAQIDAYQFDANMQNTYYKLNQALDFAVDALFDDNENFTKQDVENYIFSDNDALDSGEASEGTEAWEDIREIQHQIVNIFCQ